MKWHTPIMINHDGVLRMSQGRVIDIMTIAFLQLTVLQFLERKNGFRILDVVGSEVWRWSVLTESDVNQKELS